eukprot:TRINITY_DN28345_c0_g1_i5.p1 TRINITY_DN28345_c0_g1~~TRINITY_DN28345_c0_g1_i5.p1  ORF type:complete len:286 (+),score=78.68 TRINITY_DN28345_c0_g1_i5:167-1024(+)
MYFSQREEAAVRKCRNGQQQFAQVLITCEVDVGNVVEAEVGDMTKAQCRSRGGDSVKIIGKDVWAIYDPVRIRIKDIRDLSAPGRFMEELRRLLLLHEVAAEVERQEAKQHADFIKDYQDWGKGRLLGGRRVTEGDQASLRRARLAKLGATAQPPPARQAQQPQPTPQPQKRIRSIVPALQHAQPTPAAQKPTAAAAAASSQDSSSATDSTPEIEAPLPTEQVQLSLDEDEEELKQAILLSLQLHNVAQQNQDGDDEAMRKTTLVSTQQDTTSTVAQPQAPEASD